jgi:hypothetical protein
VVTIFYPEGISAILWSRTLTIGLLLLANCGAAEPPAITGMFPPGGQVGTEVSVVLKGKPGDGSLHVWSDQQKLSFTFAEKQDKATIKIPGNAEPGIHWLRFYNEHGTTDLRPFFVGSIPEATDTEPNNELAQAQKIDQSTINGVLHTTGEVDLFAINLEAGQTLTALVQANRELGSPMDGVLELLDPQGVELISNDDDHGNDPLVTITAANSGTYFLRLFAFPAAPNSSIRLHGAASYVYRLSVRIGTPAQTSVDAIVPENLTIPWSVSGLIGQPKETDEYTFDGTKGQSVTIKVAARANFSLLDPIAILKTEAGSVVKEFDDLSGGNPDVQFSIAMPEDGRYVLVVKDRFSGGSMRHNYVASVEENKPSFSATVAASSFVLPADKPLEIPVAVGRANGFDERVAVTIEGLPEGVTATPVHSEKEGDTAKSVTLKIERAETAKAFSGVVRIVCAAEGTKHLEQATAAKPMSKERIGELWLTVAP